MNTKKMILGVMLGAAVVAGCASAQQRPVVDIGERHGNLREAQALIVQAYEVLSRAQVANDAQLGGHAARAKDLLNQADAELRAAATYANQR